MWSFIKYFLAIRVVLAIIGLTMVIAIAAQSGSLFESNHTSTSRVTGPEYVDGCSLERARELGPAPLGGLALALEDLPLGASIACERDWAGDGFVEYQRIFEAEDGIVLGQSAVSRLTSGVAVYDLPEDDDQATETPIEFPQHRRGVRALLARRAAPRARGRPRVRRRRTRDRRSRHRRQGGRQELRHRSRLDSGLEQERRRDNRRRRADRRGSRRRPIPPGRAHGRAA